MISEDAFVQQFMFFLSRVSKMFPNNQYIKNYIAATELMVKTNKSGLAPSFLKEIEPHEAAIVAKDEKHFLESNDPSLQHMNLHDMWSVGMSEQSKANIWDTLQTLVVMAHTICDADIKKVEAAAVDTAGKLAKGEISEDQVLKNAQSKLI